jgi:hypothetical protein
LPVIIWISSESPSAALCRADRISGFFPPKEIRIAELGERARFTYSYGERAIPFISDN